ncbi:MAG TPA: CGNR zinc finger domain-containing protein [Candidatus Limnocylindria bacterium]|nr:CGNR zinc finger domain-containing protein [Candidatus Limnocylindria bacterium]
MPGSARPSAPGQLRLVHAFLLSADRESGRDDFATPGGMRRWLAAQRLVAPNAELGEEDRRSLVELRQALYELVAAGSGLGTNLRAVSTLNEAARRIRLGMRLHPDDGYRLMSEGLGLDRVVGDVLVAALSAMAAGNWSRLKVCANPACGRAFYDTSRNRSGRWCSMSSCGNRAKGRAYRRRRAEARPTGASAEAQDALAAAAAG